MRRESWLLHSNQWERVLVTLWLRICQDPGSELTLGSHLPPLGYSLLICKMGVIESDYVTLKSQESLPGPPPHVTQPSGFLGHQLSKHPATFLVPLHYPGKPPTPAVLPAFPQSREVGQDGTRTPSLPGTPHPFFRFSPLALLFPMHHPAGTGHGSFQELPGEIMAPQRKQLEFENQTPLLVKLQCVT